MDALDNYNACRAITGLVDGLSNWYVRRSRDRFWAKDTDSQDKSDAYWTLYETLLGNHQAGWLRLFRSCQKPCGRT